MIGKVLVFGGSGGRDESKIGLKFLE